MVKWCEYGGILVAKRNKYSHNLKGILVDKWLNMVEVGINRGVTGLLWKLSIVFTMFNMTWKWQIVQLSSTEEESANQDWVRYSINELKFIRSEWQKDPQSKIIPWTTLQCIRSLRIQRRR